MTLCIQWYRLTITWLKLCYFLIYISAILEDRQRKIK